MNNIYNQIGPRCSGYAVANAMEFLGVEFKDLHKAVEELYEKHGTRKETKTVMGLDDVLEVAETEGIQGHRIKDVKRIWSVFPTTFKPRPGYKLIDVYHDSKDPNLGMVFSLRVRKDEDGQKIPLTEDHVLEKVDWPVKSYHAMAKAGYMKYDGRDCLIAENSWSKKWGDDGLFLLPFPYFHTEVRSVYTFKIV